MKTAILFLSVILSTLTFSQEFRPTPTINVSGEGKIKVAPDMATITISLETKGNNAIDVKKENDLKTDAVIKFIKKSNILKEDFKTERVFLSPNYDYEKKKQNYIASQTIVINLKDLSAYESLMQGLISNGINKIDNVEFKSSNMLQLQSDARKLAIKDAKKKAEDFVFELGQKVGKASMITDNSQNYYPQTRMYEMKSAMSMDGAEMATETIAPGEIEIVVNVSVSFILE